jgi:transposase
MDEAGIQQYIYREYAKAKKGQRIFGEISGKRYVRTSIISSLNSQKKLVAPFLFTGMTDTNLVLWWVENMLLPELPKNSTIIWDNASFHKSQILREMLENAGHTMIFLPAYSPDLNPIEHKWHELKQRLRSFYDESLDFIENLCIQINQISVNV